MTTTTTRLALTAADYRQMIDEVPRKRTKTHDADEPGMPPPLHAGLVAARRPEHFTTVAEVVHGAQKRVVAQLEQAATWARHFANAAETGAALAKVLLDHPWVRSLEISAGMDQEDGDHGEQIYVQRVTVSDVKAVEGARLPKEVTGPDERLDVGLAAVSMADMMQDCFDRLQATIPGDDEGWVCVRLSRDSIAPLLATASGIVDGWEVYATLFPDEADIMVSQAKEAGVPDALMPKAR